MIGFSKAVFVFLLCTVVVTTGCGNNITSGVISGSDRSTLTGELVLAAIGEGDNSDQESTWLGKVVFCSEY